MSSTPSQQAVVFDDEATISQSLCRFLEKSYSVACAKDSADFRKHMSAKPALIYCDLNLPGGSGLEELKFAQEVSPCSARILISGFLNQEILLTAINQELVHRVLSKPFTIEQLSIVTAEAQNVNRLLLERQYWQEVSLTDGLTHLWNRRGFLQYLVREVSRARRHQRTLCLVMIDIDNFKQINDQKGHSAGDETLKQVAHILTESVRSIDWVCRYGGDEFIILLPETPAEDAFDVAERIRAKTQAELNQTISLGISVFPHHGQDPAELINCADKALYSAKSNGRNQSIIATYTQPE